jgi:hypothetical protein
MRPHRNTEPERLLRFLRASHHDGDPHQVIVRSFDLRPLSCSCRAGAYGRLCHATISVTAEDLEPIALERWQRACGEVDIRQAATVLSQVRKWARAARELQTLRTSGYFLTPAGRADLHPEPAA